LDLIDIANIRQLTEYCDDLNKLYSVIMPKNNIQPNLALDKLLQMCSHVFLNIKKYEKRIFIFTCNDECNNADERNISVRKAQDMFDNKIFIELFPLNPVVNGVSVKFSLSKFWEDIIQFDK